MTRVLALAVAACLLAACGDDGYAAPDRELDLVAVLELGGSAGRTMFRPEQYARAWEDVAGALDLDPADPTALLEETTAHRFLSRVIAACTWGAALASGDPDDGPRIELDSVAGLDTVRRMLDEHTGGDCGSLDEHAVVRIDSALPAPPESPAEWMLTADSHLIRAAIATELRPEIAEAVAG